MFRELLVNDPRMPTVGQLVAGRYEVLDVVGEGGFAVVYRATDRRLGGEVALKVLDPEKSAKPSFRERFRQEINVVRKLRHHNTIKIWDAGVIESGCLYMASEFVVGEPLSDVIERTNGLAVDRVVRIISQILKSLAEAHKVEIVHRDLKPDNIMICQTEVEDDYVKVLDFGIAKALSPDMSTVKTQTGVLMCTPSYAAPEVLKATAVLPASDIYSLGLITLEMLTGQRVFGGNSMAEIIATQLSPEPVTVPAELVGSALGDVLLTATQKESADRYQNAIQMLRALRAVGTLQPKPLTSLRTPGHGVPQEWAQRAMGQQQTPSAAGNPRTNPTPGGFTHQPTPSSHRSARASAVAHFTPAGTPAPSAAPASESFGSGAHRMKVGTATPGSHPGIVVRTPSGHLQADLHDKTTMSGLPTPAPLTPSPPDQVETLAEEPLDAESAAVGGVPGWMIIAFVIALVGAAGAVAFSQLSERDDADPDRPATAETSTREGPDTPAANPATGPADGPATTGDDSSDGAAIALGPSEALAGSEGGVIGDAFARAQERGLAVTDSGADDTAAVGAAQPGPGDGAADRETLADSSAPAQSPQASPDGSAAIPDEAAPEDEAASEDEAAPEDEAAAAGSADSDESATPPDEGTDGAEEVADAREVDGAADEPDEPAEDTIATPSPQTRLIITSEPSDARVYLDGEEVGTTPFDDQVDADNERVQITIRASGYHSWRETVELGEPEHRMAVALRRRESSGQGEPTVTLQPIDALEPDEPAEPAEPEEPEEPTTSGPFGNTRRYE
jgi:serine/threonine-protein kinase